MWNFAELRAYLVPLAEKVLDDVDKIVFAREFGVRDWLAPAHIRLCQRKEALTSEEAKKLGVESLLLMYRIKEQKLSALGTSMQCSSHSTAKQVRYCDRCDRNYDFPKATTTDEVEKSVRAWVERGCLYES